MKPRCYNRPPFKDTVRVQNGWFSENNSLKDTRKMVVINDRMSKGCQQHGQMGEATLHPERWACEGCRWKPETNQTEPTHA